jgi:hypothetical protein
MMRPTTLIASLACAVALCSCAKGPERLASDLKKALDKKDQDALLALADLKQAPSMLTFEVLDLADECAAPMICTVTTKPVDAAWQQNSDKQMVAQKSEWRIKPEGVVLLEGNPDPAAPKDSTAGKMTMEMPYAQVDGHYKLVMAHYTADRLAELKATTPQSATDATLALGIGKPGSSERNMDWKTTATALPAGGGEAGVAYVANVAEVAAAIKANDVDALATATGDWGRLVLGPKQHNGDPVPLDKRQRKMRAQAVRMVVAAQVLGGYQIEDQAVLMIEGTNGAGNTVRGAVVMERTDGAWKSAGEDLVEIPAGA